MSFASNLQQKHLIHLGLNYLVSILKPIPPKGYSFLLIRLVSRFPSQDQIRRDRTANNEKTTEETQNLNNSRTVNSLG